MSCTTFSSTTPCALGLRPDKVFFLANRAFDGVYDRETVKKWLITFLRRFFSQQF